jgi:hypothetical protein
VSVLHGPCFLSEWIIRGGELGTAPRIDFVGEIRRRNDWFSASARRTNGGGEADLGTKLGTHWVKVP